MDVDNSILIFLIGAGFIASFIDAVVGGGGLISIPALMLTGLPPTMVLGTNKFASSMASFTSTISFLYSGKINKRLAGILFPLSIVGSVAGVYTVKQIPPEVLKPLVTIMLVVITLYTVTKKDWGSQSTFKGITARTLGFGIITALSLGFYDGFFGPGTGSFLIFAFLLLGCDFVQASGNAKVLNFGSNIAAAVTFIMLGSVHYYYGLVMGISMIFGALLGSRVAIRKGSTYVRPLFIMMTVILIGKQLWSLFFS